MSGIHPTSLRRLGAFPRSNHKLLVPEPLLILLLAPLVVFHHQDSVPTRRQTPGKRSILGVFQRPSQHDPKTWCSPDPTSANDLDLLVMANPSKLKASHKKAFDDDSSASSNPQTLRHCLKRFRPVKRSTVLIQWCRSTGLDLSASILTPSVNSPHLRLWDNPR